MQTSSTLDSRSASAGFTLVEVMATLAIVALVASSVLLMSPGADSRLRSALESMATRIDLASDQSILMNRQLALVATSEGYHFERLDEDGWQRLETVPSLGFQPWPASGAPEIEDESDATTTHRLARFDPLGGATPMRLRFGEGWRVEIDQEGAVRVERAS
jgi:type II secretion system protein H